MADGIELNAGSGGAILATDDAGAAGQVQITKLAISTDGSASAIPADGSNGLDVDVTRIQAGDNVIGRVKISDGTDVALVSGSGELNVLESNSADIQTAVEAIQTAVEGTLAVNSELTTADLDTGAGTDTRAVVGLVGSKSGGAEIIPGSATDGLLVNLGANNDVTVTGTVTASGPLTDTQLRASAVAVDASGAAVPVTDNSGSLTVDAPVGTPVFVRLSDGSSAIATLPVSLASVPSHAVTNAGTFAVQESGGVLTSVQLIDDVVFAEDAASANGDKGVQVLTVRKDTAAATSGTDGDYQPLITDSSGRLHTLNHHGRTLKTVSGSLTADTDVIAAVTSKRLKVYAYSLITTDNTGTTPLFKSNGTAGTELWRVYLKGPDASTPFGANLAVTPPAFLFATAAGEKLTVDVGSAATIHYSIAYWDDDAS